MTKILRRNREDEVHVDRPVREVDRVGEQQPVDRAGRADDRSSAEQLLRERERQQRKQHGQDAGADAGDEIELQEVARAPDAFELGPEHPQRQHVEQDVEDARRAGTCRWRAATRTTAASTGRRHQPEVQRQRPARRA